MIKKAREEDFDKIKEFVNKDCARNYFIAIALLEGESVFKDIYIEEEDGEIIAALFHRESNNLQFATYGSYDVEGFKELIKSLDFEYLISPISFCKCLEPTLSVQKKGAYISYLNKDNYTSFDLEHTVHELTVDDLDEVVLIYKSIFSGHPKKEFMKEKLMSKRGRGVCVFDNDILVSVAQTEFEKNDSCIVVGVATELNEQHKGYASSCLLALTEGLLNEGKDIYLQYDNPDAGRIYDRIGFKTVDRVYHYKRG